MRTLCQISYTSTVPETTRLPDAPTSSVFNDSRNPVWRESLMPWLLAWGSSFLSDRCSAMMKSSFENNVNFKHESLAAEKRPCSRTKTCTLRQAASARGQKMSEVLLDKILKRSQTSYRLWRNLNPQAPQNMSSPSTWCPHCVQNFSGCFAGTARPARGFVAWSERSVQRN